MKLLPLSTLPSALLSFDFDGTLHFPGENPPVPPEFFQVLRRLRDSHGIVWGINTGRSMPQTVEGIMESQFPFLPDWVVAREREVYFPNQFGRWLPDAAWNKKGDKEIARLFKKLRKLLGRLRREIEDQTGARWIEMDGEPAGIIAQSEDEMEWIVAHIEPLAAAEPHLGWHRNSIYLRFGHRDFQKGSALSHLATRYGLTADRTFAMGDSHNDLEMLDPKHTGMIACPANSVDDIRNKVATAGGLLTRASHGHGAIEALLHYFPTETTNYQ
jgi:HAD superfamily hydrolase (TIGR01484 family)